MADEVRISHSVLCPSANLYALKVSFKLTALQQLFLLLSNILSYTPKGCEKNVFDVYNIMKCY